MQRESPKRALVTRRSLIAGMAGAGAAVAAASRVDALPGMARATIGTIGPEAIDPATAGLTYLAIDAVAFFPGAGSGRYSDDTSGSGVLSPPATLLAPLLLPTGSIIKQVNLAYQGTPGISLVGRPMSSPTSTTTDITFASAAGGGPKTMTHNTNVTLAANSTYSLRALCQAGDSIYGVTVGYLPPAQAFIPFSGSAPRILDTRNTGIKLAPDEERVVALGLPGVRSAVINLTVTESDGPSGYIAVFPASISWPGNSSSNWFGAGQNIANTVISAVDGSCQIRIRGGGAHTHVIIDRIGWLI